MRIPALYTTIIIHLNHLSIFLEPFATFHRAVLEPFTASLKHPSCKEKRLLLQPLCFHYVGFRHPAVDSRYSNGLLLVLIYPRHCAFFDAEERASAKVLDDLFIQLGRGDEELNVIYLAHQESLPVEIEL